VSWLLRREEEWEWRKIVYICARRFWGLFLKAQRGKDCARLLFAAVRYHFWQAGKTSVAGGKVGERETGKLRIGEVSGRKQSMGFCLAKGKLRLCLIKAG
jgi:hypothetical protein